MASRKSAPDRSPRRSPTDSPWTRAREAWRTARLSRRRRLRPRSKSVRERRVARPLLTDHFDGRRFFNPSGAQGQATWTVPRRLLIPRTRWASRIPVEPRRPPTVGRDDLVVTFVGHATLLIQV